MAPWERERGFFFGFSGEPDEKDKPHVHIKSEKGAAKFWLDPVRLVWSTFNDHELAKARKVVEDNEQELIRDFHEHHKEL